MNVLGMKNMSVKPKDYDLRQELKSAGMNNRILARKLGVNEATVSGWVNGPSVPTYVREYMRLVMIIKTAADEV